MAQKGRSQLDIVGNLGPHLHQRKSKVGTVLVFHHSPLETASTTSPLVDDQIFASPKRIREEIISQRQEKQGEKTLQQTRQNSVGQNSVGQNSVDQNSVGQNSVGRNSVGQNSVGQNSVGQNNNTQNNNKNPS